jgi:predicted ABC-class ATPase
MHDRSDLEQLLRRIDGRGYPAYKELRGSYQLDDVTLFVDHVQGDPFAAPSRVRLRVSLDRARWPAALRSSRVRRIALEDALARSVARAIGGSRTPEEGRGRDAAEPVARRGERRGAGRRGSGKSGLVEIDAGGQEILERTALRVDESGVEARLAVGLPAAGRRVLGREARVLLLEELPALAAALEATPEAIAQATRFVASAENHAALQEQLAIHGLVAFVADGAVLPRRSGASQRPLARDAVPFRAPEALRVALEVPNPPGDSGDGAQAADLELLGSGGHTLEGLGVPRGVTLVVGGGYHGKSTLLQAIERGVYPHIPGDGREQVATVESAVKIRAEDGRRVSGCDISAFIGELPQGRATDRFDSDDASGSTSQAANIVEALEVGAGLLLLDEDTSATNFMVRDARMQALVARAHEPITPFVDRVRELHERFGVSTVLVMGGCGDYFDVADTVIEMREFAPKRATEAAQRVAREHPTRRLTEVSGPMAPVGDRLPIAASIDPSKGRREEKIAVRGLDAMEFGTQRLDLRALEQLVDPSQTRAVGYSLALVRRFMGRDAPLRRVLDHWEGWIEREGLDALGRRGTDLALPRRYEVAAALNRLRSLRVERLPEGDPVDPDPGTPDR